MWFWATEAMYAAGDATKRKYFEIKSISKILIASMFLYLKLGCSFDAMHACVVAYVCVCDTARDTVNI